MGKRSGLTLYEQIGGERAIRKLVETFYPKVKADRLIGPLFPDDIEPVMEKQFMFLSQFFGGPLLYSEQFGQPMMRARHLPFENTKEKADAWLKCMREALQEIGLDAHLCEFVLYRLSGPAYPFVNTP